MNHAYIKSMMVIISAFCMHTVNVQYVRCTTTYIAVLVERDVEMGGKLQKLKRYIERGVGREQRGKRREREREGREREGEGRERKEREKRGGGGGGKREGGGKKRRERGGREERGRGEGRERGWQAIKCYSRWIEPHVFIYVPMQTRLPVHGP